MPKSSPDPKKNAKMRSELGSSSEGYPMPDVMSPKVDRNSAEDKHSNMGYTNTVSHSSIPARPDKTT